MLTSLSNEVRCAICGRWTTNPCAIGGSLFYAADC
jgi:hypothetical protein